MIDHYSIISGAAHVQRLRTTLKAIAENSHSNVYRDALRDLDLGSESMGDLLATIEPTTDDTLRSHEGSVVHVPEEHMRYLVSEFDNARADRLFLLGQRNDTPWRVLDEALQKHDVHSAVIAVSRNWQLGASFYETCRKNRVPCTVFSHRDVLYIARLVEEVGVNVLVTTADVAVRVHQALVERDCSDRVVLWVLVAEFGKSELVPKLPHTVIVDHHVFPGISVASSVDGEHIEFSDEYVVEGDESGVYFTSVENHAVPLLRFFVPGVFTVHADKSVTFVRSGEKG